MSTDDFLALLSGAKKSGDRWIALCPAHKDRNPSLSVSSGSDGRVLIKCFAGCSAESIVGALGLQMGDLFLNKAEKEKTMSTIVSEYDYRDEKGTLLYQSVRYEPKDFSQRRPDGKGGWIWNVKGVRRVPYRLPELLAAVAKDETHFVCEGEKDVDAMVKHGFCATCNVGGAGKWRAEYNEPLRGTDVVIIADKDEAGRKHGEQVARSLHGIARSLKVIELPDRDSRAVKDATDWFSAGGSANELIVIVKSAQDFLTAAKLPDTIHSDHADEMEPGEHGDSPSRPSCATQLVNLADQFEFFHDPQSRGFARMEVNGHVEVWPVNSTPFRTLLAQLFYRRSKSAVNRNALADAVATLQGRALFDGAEEPVFLRVAPHEGSILIDLCEPQWRVLQVSADGWKELERSPVAFIRTAAMRPLPIPAPSAKGSLEPLWGLLNVTPSQRPLVAGALLNGFHPDGPFFAVNYLGEQGTGKSCAAKIHRQLIDPSDTPLRSPPREDRDLLVQAGSNWIVALDNLSRLPQWLSDGLCRLATGGGHSARSLFTDGDEFTLNVKRPVILTGIEDVATRPDLAERALQIELETIPDRLRRSERQLWQDFDQSRPVIFSAILNGLVRALRDLDRVLLENLPRMADACLWATAGETAMGWEQGAFLAAYSKNLTDGATASIEAHPVGVAIQQLLERDGEWVGEPAHLLNALNDQASDDMKRAEDWPKNPRALSGQLRKLAQALRRSGIEFTRPKRGTRRGIKLCKACNSPSEPSLPSQAKPSNDANDGHDAKIQPLHDVQPTAKKLVEEIW